MFIKERPFEKRIAVPAFFYPFLSPKEDRADQEHVKSFQHVLMHPAPPEKRLLLYVHIPFCNSLCHFCGFFRVLTPDSEVVERYIQAVKREMQLYSKTEYIKTSKFESIYFGGGSPSVLSPEQIDDLLSWTRRCFGPETGTEWTFEGEARTLKDRERLGVMRSNGCNRVSFGIQSFNKDVRNRVGIAATRQDVDECIGNLRSEGYNINIDLMYGLPGQTMSVWKNDLATAVEIDAVHIDIYDTIFYPNTRLFRNSPKYMNELPDEFERVKMFGYALSYLIRSGYDQETIEDFARKGSEYEMKKMLYGGNDGQAEILGIGASSIGFLDHHAYRNFSTLEEYIDHLADNNLPLRMMYRASEAESGVRMLVYLPKLLKIIKENIGAEVLSAFKDKINELMDKGLLEENDIFLQLTNAGTMWADNIAMEFMNKAEIRKMWHLLY